MNTFERAIRSMDTVPDDGGGAAIGTVSSDHCSGQSCIYPPPGVRAFNRRNAGDLGEAPGQESLEIRPTTCGVAQQMVAVARHQPAIEHLGRTGTIAEHYRHFGIHAQSFMGKVGKLTNGRRLGPARQQRRCTTDAQDHSFHTFQRPNTRALPPSEKVRPMTHQISDPEGFFS